jgi:hypothetical protein
MNNDILEPPPVPENSKALIAILKRRLHEAIETGKASDAKIFVDIIERLAKMAWLDDLTPRQRYDAELISSARAIAKVDAELMEFLKAQQEMVDDPPDGHL